MINDKEKCSDDKEPSKTAGNPILNVLKNNNLNHILCVVIRYFGGIKLGTGGLVRAYTAATTSALEIATLTPLVLGNEFKITFKYDNIKNIDYILNNEIIINKIFGEVITYFIFLDKESDIVELIKLCIDVVLVNEKYNR
ncbi:MAG: YigZ family protein [Bacilli bacterium]